MKRKDDETFTNKITLSGIVFR